MGNAVVLVSLLVVIVVMAIILALAYTKPDMVGIKSDCPADKQCPAEVKCEDTVPLRAQISTLNNSLSDAEAKISDLQAQADELQSKVVEGYDYTLLDNHDMAVADIKTVVGTVKQCVAACNATPGCGSVVRPKDMSPTQSADCYLKPVPSFDTRFKSYVPRRADNQLFPNSDISAGGYTSMPNTNEAVCYSTCDSDMKCKAAAFNYDDYSCSLKNISSPLVVKSNTNVYIPSLLKSTIQGCGYAGMTRGFYKLGSDTGRYSFCRYVGDAPNVMPSCIIDGVDTPMVQTENGAVKLSATGQQIPVGIVGENGAVFNIDTTPHDEFNASDFYCMW